MKKKFRKWCLNSSIFDDDNAASGSVCLPLEERKPGMKNGTLV